MDPNANLEEQLEIANRILDNSVETKVPDFFDVMRLAELVLAMDEWIKKGGALPIDWRPNNDWPTPPITCDELEDEHFCSLCDDEQV